MFDDIFKPLMDDLKDEEKSEKEEVWQTGQDEDFWRVNNLDDVWKT